MDIALPDIDGYQATKANKKSREDFPILAHTAKAMPVDKKRSYAAKCDGFIAKPLNQEKLLQVIS